jgi:prepilin-type N-terminal cleavage/methylation domain-containing protein
MNIHRKGQKGFTLIELLVVIAIIGILSSIVLASLSTARTKATISAYQAELRGAVPSLLVDCDGAASGGTATVVATDRHGAITVTCDGLGGFADLQVPPIPATLAECGTVSDEGVTFTGAVCA